MRPLVFAVAAALSIVAAQARAQSAPGWKSYAVTGDPADIVSSPTVATWLGKKVDAVGGTATGLALSSPTVSGILSGSGVSLLSGAGTPAYTPYAATQPDDLIALASGGNVIQYCPYLSCLSSPTTGHQRTSALFWSTTKTDSEAEEQTVAVETTVNNGYYTEWAANTAYSAGANIRSGNNIYRVTTAGTSGTTAPTGTGSAITDGTAVIEWINQAAIASKVGLYNEEQVVAGGGQSWVQANNVELKSGAIPSFNVNTELDFTNNAADCNIGAANCNNLEMNNNGAHISTAAVHVGSTNTGNYATYWGLHINGSYLASMADIEDDSSAAVGLGFNASGLGGTHSTATIMDATSSPVSILIQGSHAAAAVSDQSTSPSAINLTGSYSYSAINIAPASGPVAISVSANKTVCFNGTARCIAYNGSKLVYNANGTNVASIDDSGNMTIKGTLTQSGTP